MSRWSECRSTLRAILAANQCLYPASVFDPISARIAKDLEFEMGMLAGSVASLTVLGAPDIVMLTLFEFAEQARRICRAVDLPLLVDADHGYGNALNVMRTVEELEAAGVSGLSIEDTELPASFGNSRTPRLLSVEEGVGKMRAALAARSDPQMVIAGRTSAAMITSIEDTIIRAKAYEAAGVDAIFLVGLQTRAGLDAVTAEIKAPLILGGVGAELMDLDYLGMNGVKICLQGHKPFAAAVQAIHETMKALRAGASPGQLENIASKDFMEHVMRNDSYKRLHDEFLE